MGLGHDGNRLSIHFFFLKTAMMTIRAIAIPRTMSLMACCVLRSAVVGAARRLCRHGGPQQGRGEDGYDQGDAYCLLASRIPDYAISPRVGILAVEDVCRAGRGPAPAQRPRRGKRFGCSTPSVARWLHLCGAPWRCTHCGDVSLYHRRLDHASISSPLWFKRRTLLNKRRTPFGKTLPCVQYLNRGLICRAT